MQRIVFIGIGWIWLSAIAHIMLDCGINNMVWIDGTIDQESLKGLEAKWLKLYEHGVIECRSDDIVLYSDAVLNSVEYKTYKQWQFSPSLEERGSRGEDKPWLLMYSYFGFAGEISKYFKTISVAGSHGKSTTTAMGISAMNKLTPKFALGIVGVLMKEFSGRNYLINSDYKSYIQKVIEHIIWWSNENNIIIWEKPYFVIEADEFNRHFHLLDTDIALITNIEHDHTDIYPSKQDYLDAFQLFVDHTKSAVITHPNIELPTHHSEQSGNSKVDDEAIHKIMRTSNHHFNFQYIFWEHNQANANLIYTLVKELGSNTEASVESIESFPGIRRRQEFLWKWKDGALISDYAHHPTEIKAIYDAIKSQYPNKKIIWIFQPHQAARVLEFEQDFIQSVIGFDELYIFPIYAARENYELLAAKYPQLKQAGNFIQYGKTFAGHCKGRFLENYDQAWKIIDNQKDQAIIVIMTAGNLDWEIRKKISQTSFEDTK